MHDLNADTQGTLLLPRPTVQEECLQSVLATIMKTEYSTTAESPFA